MLKEHYLDINGRSLFALEAGSGQPTVIFEAGLGDFSSAWHFVQAEISKLARTLSYDRAGRGQSQFASAGRNLDDCVTDLAAIIEITHTQPPFIIVGHSFGGFIARLFAHRFPNKVGGIVLIDSPQEDFFSAAKEAYKTLELPARSFDEPLGVTLARFYKTLYLSPDYPANELNEEGIDLAACKKQVRGAASLNDMPVTVISAARHDMYRQNGAEGAIADFDIQLEQLWARSQHELFNLSTQAVQVIAEESRHYVQDDQPEIVIRAVSDAIRWVRRKHELN